MAKPRGFKHESFELHLAIREVLSAGRQFPRGYKFESYLRSAFLNQTRRGHLAVASSFLVLSYRLGLRLLSHTGGHLYMAQDEFD
jgi:hypothetical protein